MTTIYHNPRCSKSRNGIEYLQKKGIEFQIVKYLETSMDTNTITEIVRQLGIKSEQLVRKNEELYKTQYKGKELTDTEWIRILAENPILIERPIIVHNDKAVIARPTEKIDEILN